MTENRANEILRSKYPDGEIRRKHSTSAENKYWIKFKADGKVYYYSGTSYQQVLEKLGFEVIYKHNIEALNSEIETLNKRLESLKNGNKPKGLTLIKFNSDADRISFEITRTEKQLDEAKATLKYFTNDCIIV